jgi:hypothetical protein
MSSSLDLTAPHKKLSVRDFYADHMNEHNDEQQTLFWAKRLFQEYCCCAWSRVERQRLFYLKQNQKALRAENYNTLRDVSFGDHMNATDAVFEKR